MDEGGFVAPTRQPRHDPTMRARAHKAAHRRFVAPHRARPERPVGVAQQPGRKIPRRPPGLMRRAQRLHQEHRQVMPRPHPQPGHRDERHRTPPGAAPADGDRDGTPLS
jgi:hypothetical protein